jgi:hypothetical protein
MNFFVVMFARNSRAGDEVALVFNSGQKKKPGEPGLNF